MFFKGILAFGVILGSCIGSSATSSEYCCESGFTILSIAEVKVSDLESFFKGETSKVVVECPAGLELPFSMSFKGAYLSLEDDEAPRQVKFLKTCYIRFVNNDFLFSGDLTSWKSFGEFFSGEFGVGVCDDTRSISLHLELNSKN